MENIVDIVIPTYNIKKDFLEVVRSIKIQSIKATNLILVNTDENLFYKADLKDDILKILDGKISLLIKHIDKKEFNHGSSRNLGVSFSKAKYVVFLTMDAIFFDEHALENLISSMNEDIKLAYARQIAKKDADIIEKFTRNYNYGESSIIKSKESIEKYKIKNYFCSNVCACYEREFFQENNGFEKNVILNEDSLFAYKVIEAGKKVLYNANAKVLHSHNYSAFFQFKRNFDIGVSHREYQDIFLSLKTENEGINLVKDTYCHLIKNKKYLEVFKLFYLSVFKFLGYKIGLNYRLLPNIIRMNISLNKQYWKN